MSESPSYGYTYLTSYGWTGTGTGLRKGAIEKPLAIPLKKNLGGLGKDRDEAFPFWDHLFAAASKVITIRVSSDDDDDAKDPSHTDPASLPFWRTTTGILSNRRPISGTPASTSGYTTPSLLVDNAGHPSLLATAKREAAKRGLYARFFRGPVLDPDRPNEDSDPHGANIFTSLSWSAGSSSPSTPVPKRVDERLCGDLTIAGETKKSKKRKLEVRAETKDERKERKRLKRERKAVRAARKAEKDQKMLANDKANEKMDRLDRKARKQWDEETRSEENETILQSKKARKRARNSVVDAVVDELGQAKGARKKLKGGTVTLSTHDAQHHGVRSHRPACSVNLSNASTVVLTTKKKKGKRRDTPS